MTTKSGKLRNNTSFCGMIENLGDAYEAAEECYGMVWWMARALSEREPDISREQWIARAEQNCREGLRLGGVQRSR
jgi:hypothetical protein